jgi:hypothetical protein
MIAIYGNVDMLILIGQGGSVALQRKLQLFALLVLLPTNTCHT